MYRFLLLFCFSFFLACEGKEGPMGPAGPTGEQGPQGEQGTQGERGQPAPTSEITALRTELSEVQARLDSVQSELTLAETLINYIFSGQEPEPLSLGETQLRFVNGFIQEKYGSGIKGEIENYGNFDAINVRMYLRFRDINGSAIEEGWYLIGTVMAGEIKLFNIATDVYSNCVGCSSSPIKSMDFQFLYTEGGEDKIGGEGNIRID